MEYTIVEGKKLNSKTTSIKDSVMLKFKNRRLQLFSDVHYLEPMAVNLLAGLTN